MRKSAIKWFGLAISAACLGYFFVEAREILSGMTISWSGSQTLRAMPIAAAPYLVAYCLLALAWHCLLHLFGLAPTLTSSIGIYLTAQIAKYLPGNVGHHIGRIYLASTHGLPSVRVGMSMIIEVALVVAASALVSLPLAPLVLGLIGKTGWKSTAVALASVAVCVVLGVHLMGRYRVFAAVKAHVKGAVDEALSAGNTRFLVFAAALTVAGMVLAGGSLVGLSLPSLPSVSPMSLIQCIALFSAAWIAGFLTPGAPAGLGVREAILLAGLGPLMGREAALEVTILFRALSVASDLVALLAGGLLLLAAKRTGPVPA